MAEENWCRLKGCYHSVSLLFHQLDLALNYLNSPAGVSTTGVAANPAMLDSNSIFPSSYLPITALVPAFVHTTNISTSSAINHTILITNCSNFPPVMESSCPSPTEEPSNNRLDGTTVTEFSSGQNTNNRHYLELR